MSSSSLQPCRKDNEWATCRLSDLIDHIVQSHHAYLRRELPRLNRLAQTCGETLPRIDASKDLRGILVALTQELMQHMQKEEMVLFPWMAELESAGACGSHHCGTIAAPVQVMEHEHRMSNEAMFLMRCATSDYQPADSDNADYRALVEGLAALETDLHQHIHEENTMLFPRAMQLEAMLFSNA